METTPTTTAEASCDFSCVNQDIINYDNKIIFKENDDLNIIL